MFKEYNNIRDTRKSRYAFYLDHGNSKILVTCACFGEVMTNTSCLDIKFSVFPSLSPNIPTLV